MHDSGWRQEAGAAAVRYRLSNRGFFSEFNILAYAYADCLARGARLYVDDRKCGVRWRALFSPFPPGVDQLDPRAEVIELSPKGGDGAWQAMRKAVRDACLERRPASAPALGFEGPFDQLVFAAAAELFKPTSDLSAEAERDLRRLGLELASYCAVQMRRGDKTEGYVNGRGKLVVETTAMPFAVYAECLEKLAPDVRDVLVLTDDYGAFEEAREAHPEFRLHTLCAPHERGYFHAEHLAQAPERRLADLRRLIVTAILARSSAAFVGTYWSNLSTAVFMLHQDRARCASIDLSQAWPPLDPLFLPGRDVIGARRDQIAITTLPMKSPD
jgi:hypothetical protein